MDTSPTWYDDTAVAAREARPLTSDLDVDVCVIGGGLAGLSVARELARRGWRVAILEARRVAWNASGRHSGFVLPGFAAPERRLIERVGFDHARALWGLSQLGVDAIRRAIRTDRMRAVEPVAGFVSASRTDSPDRLARRADLLASLGCDVELWPTERTRSSLRTDRYFQALHMRRAFHVHAVNYAQGLAAAAVADGARICEETPALALDTAGIRKRVTTPGGRVRAEHVVLAGGSHLGGLMPRLAGTLLPVWRQVMVTEPLGPALADAVATASGVGDGVPAGDSYRVVGGDRLLWSGRVRAWETSPPRAAARMSREIARLYPGLGLPKVARAWGGVCGRTIHNMPQIGRLSPGIWVASGLSTHGLNVSAMAGILIAQGIAERDDRWRLFTPFELVWAGGLAGRMGLASRDIGLRWGGRLGAPGARLLGRLRRPSSGVHAGLL